MSNENKNSLPPAMKQGRKWGLIIAGILAVAAPAWTGAVQSMNSGSVAGQAVAQSAEAVEKTQLSYELLNQKVTLEIAGLIKELERQDKRMDRIDGKLDKLLMRAARNSGSNREVEEIKAMAAVESKVNESAPAIQQMKLPKNLDLAYKSRKAAATKAAVGL